MIRVKIPAGGKPTIKLEGLLTSAGKVKGVDYERHDYAGQGHGFVGAAATEAQGNAADFLEKHLG